MASVASHDGIPGDRPGGVVASTLVVMAIALGFVLLYVFQQVWLLLLIGVVIATALKPIANWIQERGLSRTLSIICVYGLLGLAIATPTFLLFSRFTDQVTGLVGALPKQIDSVTDRMAHSRSYILQRIARQLKTEDLNKEIKRGISRKTEQVQAPPESQLTNITQLLESGQHGLRVVLMTIAVLLFSFYWSMYEQRSQQSLLMLIPEQRRAGARDLLDALQSKVGAYVRGQLILCGVVAVLCFIAYKIIGLRYALPLAAFAGVLEVVPVFGPIMFSIPPILVAASEDPSQVVWVIVAQFAIQQSENYLLVPRVMDRSVGVTPLVTLLALAAFGSLFGLLGAVLAIPLAAMAQVLLERFVIDPVVAEPNQSEGRDQASLLRYQARELMQDVRQKVRRKDTPAEGSDGIEEAIEALAADLDKQLAACTATAAAAGAAATASRDEEGA